MTRARVAGTGGVGGDRGGRRRAETLSARAAREGRCGDERRARESLDAAGGVRSDATLGAGGAVRADRVAPLERHDHSARGGAAVVAHRRSPPRALLAHRPHAYVQPHHLSSTVQCTLHERRQFRVESKVETNPTTSGAHTYTYTYAAHPRNLWLTSHHTQLPTQADDSVQSRAESVKSACDSLVRAPLPPTPASAVLETSAVRLGSENESDRSGDQ